MYETNWYWLIVAALVVGIVYVQIKWGIGNILRTIISWIKGENKKLRR